MAFGSFYRPGSFSSTPYLTIKQFVQVSCLDGDHKRRVNWVYGNLPLQNNGHTFRIRASTQWAMLS